MIKSFTIVAGLGSLIAISLPGAASAATIIPTTSAGQAIGSVIEGTKYTVSATGTIYLCATCNNGRPLDFHPDGTVPDAMGDKSLFSSPSDHDSDGSLGYYGRGINFGELYGSFVENPIASDLFAIGYGTTFTANNTGTLYGVINDSNYSDNPATPQFSVTLTPAVAAVPEPASWAMMIVGFGLIGAGKRYLQRRTVLRYA